MQVETTRFGPIEVPDDELVAFTDGLPGFEGVRAMALLGAGELEGAGALEGAADADAAADLRHHSLFWLQDVADPDLAFLTIVPWTAYPDYDIDIEAGELDGADADDVCVLTIVTARRGDGGVRLTSNLMAPVLIDTNRRVGRQVILQDSDWPVQAPLAESRPNGAG